jgi:hypothetical protein
VWLGRSIAQAVSRWLLTAVTRVRARVWSSGICGGQGGAGAGFLRVLQLPLPILHILFSMTGLCILHITFFSNILNMFSSVTVKVNVFAPCITTGSINVLCACSLPALHIILLVSILRFAK